MAKIKYDPLITPLNKEHYGYTFQRNNYGHSMFPASKSGRKRYPLQWEKMQFMSKAIRQWRNMSAETVNAWDLFAFTFPQPTEKDPGTFLTGYQLFLKRHFYRFLHEGINFAFLLEPELSELPTPGFSVSIAEDGMCVDVTEEYIRNFGILPQVGQFIICRIIPMATNSGQFFAPFVATLEVQEVYIDGLVCSFNFPTIVENIVFSLYMSKPVWESSQYAGSKFRYMGCFKPTQFIQLTDTPESYEGQAGKIVSVKDDETGVEFTESEGCDFCLPDPATGAPGETVQVNPAGDGYELAEGGGGGISCADLLDCSIIISILDSIATMAPVIAATGETSVPVAIFGGLFDYYAIEDSRLISSSNDWYPPGLTEFTALITALSGASAAGGHMKETGLTYWSFQSSGTDNSSKFNARGAGRNSYNGLHAGHRVYSWIYTSEVYTSTYGYMYKLEHSKNSLVRAQTAKRTGVSLRLVKSAPGIADGIFTSYTGNDGKVYRCVSIGGYYWMADNSKETKWRNGDSIPQMNSNSEWNAAGTSPKWSYPAYTISRY